MSTAVSTSTAAAQIALSREGNVFRLSFPYREELVAAVRTLPYASFDSGGKTWTVVVCSQTVDTLRQWYFSGVLDTSVDTLLQPGENPPPAAAAVLRLGKGKRPYIVTIGIRDDSTFSRLRAVAGASWDKKLSALTYPSSSAVALNELVAKNIISDPDGCLSTDGAVVMFDTRTGTFTLSTQDTRAREAFSKYFPRRDVVTQWREKNLDVSFLDDFTADMYTAEIARTHPLETPEGFLIDLYPHQRIGYSVALAREGHAIFDEPGLGKSATAIAAGYTRLGRGDITRVVVVVPAAVRTQWRNEIERFTGDTSVVVISGSAKERDALYEQGKDARWVILHYDVLSRDERKLRDLFNGAFVVADEAHRIKSRAAARTKALKELCKTATGRLALTGTPLETSPEEWFEIISGWTTPGCLGSGYEFNERYRWKNRWGGYEGARNVPELRERSKPFYTRYTKKEVATHLPPLSVHHKILDPSPAYAAALRRAHADAVAEIRTAALTSAAKRGGSKQGDLTLLDEGVMSEVSDGAEMTAVGLLRLLCSSPRIVEESDSAAAAAMREAGLIPDDDGPKIEEIRAIAAGLKSAQASRFASMEENHAPTPSDVSGERMVVFTFSKRMANLIAARLREDGVDHVLYTGDTSHKDRDAAVASFTDPTSTVQVFISTDAGAEGLNLGKCCNLLINADLAWTASRMAQRAQRIHRLDGTASKYIVVNLTIAGTIEAGILKLLASRAELTDALFGEDGGRLIATGRRGKDAFVEALAQYSENPET
jgi:SNF2 family DNA or RNA helicase